MTRTEVQTARFLSAVMFTFRLSVCIFCPASPLRYYLGDVLRGQV